MAGVLCAAMSAGALPAQTQTDEVEVTVRTIEPNAIEGPLVSLSLKDGLVLRGETGEARRLPTTDLVRVTATNGRAISRPQEAVLTLLGGDVLYGRIDQASGEAVVIDTKDLGRLSAPLDAVSRLDTALAATPAYREYAEWFERRPHGDEDQVLVTNGDVIGGFVNSIGSEGVSIEGELGETVIPYRLVVTVRLTSRPAPTPSRPHAILTMRASGRFAVTDLKWSGNVAEAHMCHGQAVQIEAERIIQVDVVGGRWEWLGQHQPISYEHTPMLSLTWEYVPDRNVLGGPITVAGERFDHGVGVHSRSSLTYDLKGTYREFVTHFGIDDDSGPSADVSVFILVDGKRRFAQDHIRRGQLFGPMRLDVAHANRIELIVDFGDNGDIQDRFNWVEAALIR